MTTQKSRRTQKSGTKKQHLGSHSAAELKRMLLFDGMVEAVCSECGESHVVEPDARRYACAACGEKGTVTSPLVKLGLM